MDWTGALTSECMQKKVLGSVVQNNISFIKNILGFINVIHVYTIKQSRPAGHLGDGKLSSQTRADGARSARADNPSRRTTPIQ
jgi:hypothetical protein